MSQTPTDPIRLLLEAAEKLKQARDVPTGRYTVPLAFGAAPMFLTACENAVPALTALVAEREKVRALMAEMREPFCPWPTEGRSTQRSWADRLAAILEGK